MESKNILKSNYLDILFENKNKDYGAYPLRKFYNERIKKSLGITLLLVVVFAGFQSWRMSKKVVTFVIDDPVTVELDRYKKKDDPEKPKPKQPKITKPIAQAPVTNIVVVPDILVKDPIPDIDEIDTVAIGTTRTFGTTDSGFVNVAPGPPQTPTTVGHEITTTVIPEEEGPLYNPSQMPEFPGGIDGLKNYMLRNLRQPDDIEEGQKIMVMVKFVVSKTGFIKDIEIIKNGREDLDDEVIRVVKRMPAWKPGLQNGLAVDVYYKIPVTFTAMD